MRATLALFWLLTATALAGCQTDDGPSQSTSPTGTTEGGMVHNPTMSHSPGMSHGDGASATEPGQAAFAALQEVVAILEADPSVDWARVNLSALREHLVDMDEVTLRSEVHESAIEGGLEAIVRGEGRTLEAIQRMVPAHAAFLDAIEGWSVQTSEREDGVALTVTTESDADHVRGLGFFGLLVTQSHHQEHHLAIAKGNPPH